MENLRKISLKLRHMRLHRLFSISLTVALKNHKILLIFSLRVPFGAAIEDEKNYEKLLLLDSQRPTQSEKQRHCLQLSLVFMLLFQFPKSIGNSQQSKSKFEKDVNAVRLLFCISLFYRFSRFRQAINLLFWNFFFTFMCPGRRLDLNTSAPHREARRWKVFNFLSVDTG